MNKFVKKDGRLYYGGVDVETIRPSEYGNYPKAIVQVFSGWNDNQRQLEEAKKTHRKETFVFGLKLGVLTGAVMGIATLLGDAYTDIKEEESDRTKALCELTGAAAGTVVAVEFAKDVIHDRTASNVELAHTKDMLELDNMSLDALIERVNEEIEEQEFDYECRVREAEEAARKADEEFIEAEFEVDEVSPQAFLENAIEEEGFSVEPSDDTEPAVQAFAPQNPPQNLNNKRSHHKKK